MAFKIVIPVYNGEKWIASCIKSVLAQSCTDWKARIVDDHSTDSTLKVIQSLSADPRITIVANKRRLYKQYNELIAYKRLYEKDEDILCTIDGDDFLTRNDALQLVYDFYKQNNCWATYGSMVKWPSLTPCLQRVFSESQGLARTVPWIFDQLRTYKAFIWKQSKDQDYRGSDGKFFIASSDEAVFRPVLEMCTSKRALRFPYYIYAWNTVNPLNDAKVHKVEQKYTYIEVEKKKGSYTPYHKK